MTTLNFNNERQAIINLPELTQSDSEGNKHLPNIREEARDKGEVSIAFFSDEFEYSINPTMNSLMRWNILKYIKEGFCWPFSTIQKMYFIRRISGL